MKLLLLLTTEPSMLCFLVKRKMYENTLKHINYILWSNFPLEMLILCNRKVSQNCQFCQNVSGSHAISSNSQKKGMPFCKTFGCLAIWFYFRSDDIQVSSWKNLHSIWETELYLYNVWCVAKISLPYFPGEP